MMTHGPEVEVLLGLAGAFRRVPLAALAATLHMPLPTLRDSTRRLLLSFLDPDDQSLDPPGRDLLEGGVGEGSQRSPTVPTVPTVPSVPTVPTVRRDTEPLKEKTVSGGTVPSEPSDAPARETALTGEALAFALADETNLPFYRTLLGRTDPALVERALAETLARRHELRGRPGAYFTAIIRRLTHPSPYA